MHLDRKAFPKTLYYRACTKALPSTTLHYKACTKNVPVLLCTTKLAQSTSQYYFVLQSLHKARPSTTLYCKVCAKYFPVLLCTSTKHVPVLLCTTKLAQSTSQYCFVPQSLHKALPSTTLYYKACTKHFPVLLCTTKLAQSTSQCYFVLQSSHKARSSTTLYCKACTKHFPALLCTTKLAQSTSQYYFVLQSSHKARSSTTLYCKACTKSFPIHPNTTLYYKACTKHFPVLLCTTKLAQSTSQLKSTDKSHNLPSRCGFIRFFGRVSSLQTLQVHPISSDFRASSHQLPAFKPQKLSQNAPCLVLASTSDHPRRDPRWRHPAPAGRRRAAGSGGRSHAATDCPGGGWRARGAEPPGPRMGGGAGELGWGWRGWRWGWG